MNDKPYRICLIEDDEIMGEALVDRFGLEGFECDWFKAGKPALATLARKRYDVVISDIQLPDLNGETLFEELRNSGLELPPYLFVTGYVKGAYTGAVRDKKGVFEKAHGGTLFLDEIGDMPPAMQVKLLRSIQERRIVRVGGETPIAVDFKLVCATHQDLKRMVEAGEFREDLYYRIHVIHLHIPPLRERKEDILWVAGRLLDAGAAEHGGQRRSLHRSAEKPLLDYPWPGNIRELKHCLERACILSQQPVLTPELLFSQIPPSVGEPSAETLNDYLQACEKRYIEEALRASGWRIAEAAHALGISRKNLWEKMKKLRIQDAPAVR